MGSKVTTSIRSIMFTVIITAFLLTIALGHASGDDDGKGDLDDDCVGCHSDGGSGTVSISSEFDTFEAGQDVIISIPVNMDSSDSDAMMPGVMILSGAGSNVKGDGWTISSDPNGNALPMNYNEMSGISGETEFQWTLVAPETPGDYSVFARLIYDDGGAKFLETEALSFTITEASSVASDTDTTDERPDQTPKALSFGILVGIVGIMIITILRRR